MCTHGMPWSVITARRRTVTIIAFMNLDARREKERPVEVVGVAWSVVAVCRPRRSDIKCVGDGWFCKSPSEHEPPEPLRGASPLAVTCGAARTQGDGVMRKKYMYINTA